MAVSSSRQPSSPASQQQQQQEEEAPQKAITSSSSTSSSAATGSSSAGARSPLAAAAAMAGLAAAVAAVPLLLPHDSSATSILAAVVPHSLQQHQAWETLYCGCVAVGASTLLVTIVCTNRFILSFYPGLEKEAERHRWRLPWIAVTLFDPLLQPMRRQFFGQTEEGDLDYAALALLATVCSLLECLVGKEGLLNDQIPDFGLLAALQFIIFFQHGMLLPSWVLVVLRWGKVL